jgi:uroporphyrinogen-III synthase
VAALQTASTNDTSADAIKSVQTELQALGQKLAEQDKLLATLQRTEAGGGDREGAALLIAAGQLRAALATSRPYGNELRAAEALARERPDALGSLQRLDAHAEQGIPTLAILSQRFPSVIDDVLRATPSPSNGDWLDRASGELKRVFHVRRVAERPGNDPADTDGVLVAAEKALKSGDLAGAVAALTRLAGPAAEAAKPWLDAAGARLDADHAIADLDMAALRGFLAAPTSGAKP